METIIETFHRIRAVIDSGEYKFTNILFWNKYFLHKSRESETLRILKN